MILLQPWMLWGLAVSILPILIHLLNRLRYRTVRWGAMGFLRQVTRSALRRSKLRHYLILALRAATMAFLALAMTRPMMGGRIGAMLAGPPDAILVLLDRSPSMERTDPRLGASRRAHGLSLLARLPPEATQGSRIVLIESAETDPIELASLTTLPTLTRAGPADVAADPAAMLEAALDWIGRNRPGRAELWLLSDGQSSNWRPNASVWPSLAARLAGLGRAIRVNLLLLQSGREENASIQIADLRRATGSRGEMELLLTLRRARPGPEPVQAVRVLNGERTLLSLPAEMEETEHLLRLPAADGVVWGWIELPADENRRDNTAYFVYGEGPLGAVWTRATEPVVRQRVEAAFTTSRADAVPVIRWWPESGPAPLLADTGLVIWQGAPPEDESVAALDRFLREGGVVLAMPPEPTDAPDRSHRSARWRWRSDEVAELGPPLRVPRWETRWGPLADAAGDLALPIAEAAVRKRCLPIIEVTTSAVPIAVFSDGEPALSRVEVGEGRLYLLATLPIPSWSDWDDGRIWIPMLWRLREEGSRRLSEIRMSWCGELLPGDRNTVWAPVGVSEHRDVRFHAGIYRAGGRWVARNRSPAEDLVGELSAEEIRKLLPGVPIHMPQEAGRRHDLYTEASALFLLLAALCLLAEATLALADFVHGARKSRNRAAWEPTVS